MDNIITDHACAIARHLYDYDCALTCEFFGDSIEFVVTHSTPMGIKTEVAREFSLAEIEDNRKLYEVMQTMYEDYTGEYEEEEL